MSIKIKYIIVLLLILLTGIVWAGSQSNSGLTPTDIILDARYKLNAISESGVTNPIYSDTEMLQWVNDGMIDIAKKTGCLQDTESVTMVADQIEYSLSNEYIEINGVVLNKLDGSILGLKEGNIWSIGRTESDFGTDAYKIPEYWYEFNGKVGVYPSYVSGVTLAESGVTTTVTVYESILPSGVTVSETIDIPSMYDKALVLYVEAQGHKKAGKVSLYQATMEEYRTELGLDRSINEQTKEKTEVIE